MFEFIQKRAPIKESLDTVFVFCSTNIFPFFITRIETVQFLLFN